MLMFFRNLLLVTVALFLVGCVNITKPVSMTAKPEPDSAYLYGKFKLSEASPEMDIVLMIKDVNAEIAKKNNPYEKKVAKRYGLRFNKQSDVYTIAIKPGKYRIEGFQYGSGGQLMKSNNDFDKNEGLLSEDFEVEAGKIYYMGDWYGKAEISSSYMTTHYRWKLEKFEMNHAKTTEAFLTQYSLFQSLPQEIAFELNYSESFDRNNPGTYTLNDLHKAIGYMEHDLALTMANELKDREPDAGSVLGYLYERGLGVDKNFGKALDYYIQAVKDKSPRAMARLSGMYADFAKTMTDKKKKEEFIGLSIQYLELAALHGNVNSVAMQCKLFFDENAPQSLRNYGTAWCNVGSKMVNDDNRDIFSDSPVVLGYQQPIDKKDQIEVGKLETEILKKMANNKVVFQ